jgi:hypothetical protein
MLSGNDMRRAAPSMPPCLRPDGENYLYVLSRRRLTAPLARRQRRAQPWGGPPSARRAEAADTPDQGGSCGTADRVQGTAVFLATQSSSSRPPRQRRPPGVATRSATPTFDPASTHKDSGACEEDGGSLGPGIPFTVVASSAARHDRVTINPLAGYSGSRDAQAA